MVLYDPQEFGGLEEYATTLAVGLQQQGHQTSVLSATWVPANNQYMLRLRDNGVPIIQLPKWLSYPASHWDTKEQILADNSLAAHSAHLPVGHGALFIRQALLGGVC